MTFFKVSPDIINRPEVCELARGLSMPVFAAVGAVSLLYAWGFEHADADGGINDFTAKAIESACGWEGARGGLLSMFCAAGILDGDPEERDENNPLRIAGWDDIASELVKVREQTRKRVAKHRENAKNVTPFVSRDVTDAVTRYETRDVTDAVTRLESREYRVESREIESRECDTASPRAKPTRAHFIAPQETEVAQYMQEQASQKGLRINAQDQAERFCDHYASNGWKVGGKSHMKDWKASARSWLRNDFTQRQPQKQEQTVQKPMRFASDNLYG